VVVREWRGVVHRIVIIESPWADVSGSIERYNVRSRVTPKEILSRNGLY